MGGEKGGETWFGIILVLICPESPYRNILVLLRQIGKDDKTNVGVQPASPPLFTSPPIWITAN